MTHSPISKHLSDALTVLRAFSPYPGHPSRASWENAMDQAEDVLAQLELMEAVHPGTLHRMVHAAHDEVQARRRPMKEITDLIGRYAKSER